MVNQLDVIFKQTSARHPKCKGVESWNPDCGYDFDCEYDTKLTCDECKYGAGRKDPEARCNRNEY